MSTLEQKQHEYEDVRTIRFVTSTLLEVSAERIKKLRDQFEQNQLFYSEISELYALVKANAERNDELAQAISKKERKVSVAITSNSRFYGTLNRQIITSLSRHIEEQKAETRTYMVIGSVGQRLMENSSLKKKCVYLSFAGDNPTQLEVQHLLNELDPYGEILILYPQFVNVFTQSIGKLDVTHTAPPEKKHEEDVEYLFEPELPRILSFFETRVRYLLFQRAMLESELARTAARLNSMSRAEDRATQEMKKVRVAILREQQTFDSLRLLESLAGSLKWRTAAKHNS